MKDLEVPPSNFRKVAKALAGEIRIQILELLTNEQKNLNEIATAIDIPLSTATVNVQKLEDAGLISAKLEPGKRGTQKICSLNFNKVIFDIGNKQNMVPFKEISIPVGHFSNAKVTPPCGICTDIHRLGKVNDFRSYYLPERLKAQLIWFNTGFLEYNFPKSEDIDPIESLEIIMEICSEVPYYNNSAKSDISVWINDIDLGFWRSPGDFGGKKGRLTPKWWGIHKTQYGLLVTWKITNNGTYCNNNLVSEVCLKHLQLGDNAFISVKIGVKEDAKYARGINLFGQKFGNHPTDIVMRFNI
ncbi:MAG: helix-turn-helix domain-containing protein [Spirochaetaceae bacterium]